MADYLGAELGEHRRRHIGQHFSGTVVAVGIEIGCGEIGAVERTMGVYFQRLFSELFHHVVDLVVEKELGVELALRLGVVASGNHLLKKLRT